MSDHPLPATDSGIVALSSYQSEGKVSLTLYAIPSADSGKFVLVELEDGLTGRVQKHGIRLKDPKPFLDLLEALRTGQRDDVAVALHGFLPLG